MRHILLVDPSSSNRDLLVRRLGRQGFEITAVASCADGLATATADPPGLVLLSLELPDQEPLAAIRRFQEDLGTTRPPIIGLTTSPHTEDYARAQAAGCRAVLPIPVDLPRLLEAIATVTETA